MKLDDTSAESAAPLRLCVVTEADPGALLRVLQHFCNRNIVPRRVCAERLQNEVLEIHVEVTGLSGSLLALIASKLEQTPSVLRATWNQTPAKARGA